MSRKGKCRSLPFALTTMVFAILAFPMLAAAQKATGGGTFDEDGATSTFSFNAIEHKNGSVTGNLTYHYRAGDLFIKMDIDCLNIIGNKAVMSGTITQVKGAEPPPVLFVGAKGIFQVEDNGEGGDALPDRVSNLRLLPTNTDVTCFTFRPRLFFPISGNFQVKP